MKMYTSSFIGRKRIEMASLIFSSNQTKQKLCTNRLYEDKFHIAMKTSVDVTVVFVIDGRTSAIIT
jgi:hypothetical protein